MQKLFSLVGKSLPGPLSKTGGGISKGQINPNGSCVGDVTVQRRRRAKEEEEKGDAADISGEKRRRGNLGDKNRQDVKNAHS